MALADLGGHVPLRVQILLPESPGLVDLVNSFAVVVLGARGEFVLVAAAWALLAARATRNGIE